jgi:hypothetical protein
MRCIGIPPTTDRPGDSAWNRDSRGLPNGRSGTPWAHLALSRPGQHLPVRDCGARARLHTHRALALLDSFVFRPRGGRLPGHLHGACRLGKVAERSTDRGQESRWHPLRTNHHRSTELWRSSSALDSTSMPRTRQFPGGTQSRRNHYGGTEAGHQLDRVAILTDLLLRLEQRMDRLFHDGPSGMIDEFTRRCSTLGTDCPCDSGRKRNRPGDRGVDRPRWMPLCTRVTSDPSPTLAAPTSWKSEAQKSSTCGDEIRTTCWGRVGDTMLLTIDIGNTNVVWGLFEGFYLARSLAPRDRITANRR